MQDVSVANLYDKGGGRKDSLQKEEGLGIIRCEVERMRFCTHRERALTNAIVPLGWLY